MNKILVPVMFGMILFAISCSSGSDDATVEADPEFTYIAESWVPSSFSLDMGDYWQSQGITHAGKNYYLITKPAENTTYSERFNPASKYFQSWVGIYTVKDKNGETYGITDGILDQEAVIKLGIADQTGWLKDFACIPELLNGF